MTSRQPKLRSDLELREQISAHGRVVVVKDPANGEFFRLQEAEQFIALQLDGETPLESVRSRAEEKFGAPLEPEALTGFIKTLDHNGLLESEDGSSRRRGRRRRLNGGLLYLRFRLYDPARLFDRLIHWVQFFFTPQFMIFSACLMCAATMVTMLNWETIVQEVAALYSLATLPMLVVTVFLVVTAHEFAHGLTCRHFGGEVREMGFLLMYFQPALYCNVSDAWLFPEKSKRLWVGFAGPYFELFLWASATVAWRVTDAGTWINQISLVVMAVSGIKTLFNFNPLIKLDGYYLLSDWLDIPNLRQKSFRYVGDFLRCLGGLAGRMPAVPHRERWIFLTYGMTAWIFSVSLLGYVALWVGDYLIVEQQRMAFLAFSGLIGFRLRGKFRKLFRRSSESSEIKAGDPPALTSDPPDGTEAKVRAKELSRRSKRLRRLILKLAGAAALLLLLFFGRTELRVAGPINVLPHHNADVRTEVEGLIAEIYVDEGKHVDKGDLIARLLDRDVRAGLQKIEAQTDENRARLKLLEAGARPEEIQLAQQAVARAEEQLKFARDRLGRDRQLYEQQLLSFSDYQESARQVASGSSDLAEAKKKLELLQAGNRPEEIEAMKATIASLVAQHHHLEEELRLMRIVSPAAGVVTTPTRQLKEMQYQFVGKGDLIAKVHDFQTITTEIALSEKEIADVRTGQTVALKVRSYPDRVFIGKVTGIATTVQGAAVSTTNPSLRPASSPGNAGKSGSTILVTTEIDNQAGLLKPGMTGMAKIYCGERRFIDLMTRRLARTFRVEFWSWW